MKIVKTISTSLLIILLTLPALPLQAASKTSNEYQAVVDTAYKYFNGLAGADQGLLNDSFDMEFGDVKMLQLNKDTQQQVIRTVPLKEFAAFFKEPTKDTWHAKVLSVDIVDDTMAMVKLNFETSKTHYIDYLVMYKRQNKWLIVNKTVFSKSK